MPRPKRSEQYDRTKVCIVHCQSRCVRGAFLTGLDPNTSKDYSYRREWIQRRLEALASALAMDVLSYCVMSNHVHLILRNRPDVVATLTNKEVALRWLQVYPGRRSEDLVEPTEEQVVALAADEKLIEELRLRLADVSWFMKSFAEVIARRANLEEKITGRFWQGRFNLVPIKDELGLLACATYVDSNPARANLADTPETSLFTSAYDRIMAEKGEQKDSAAFSMKTISAAEAAEQIQEHTTEQRRAADLKRRRNPTGRIVSRDAWLAPLTLSENKTSLDPEVHCDGLRASDKGFLHISLSEYVALLRWTMDQKKADSGTPVEAPKEVRSLLSRFRIDKATWLELVWNWKRYFKHTGCIGHPETREREAEQAGKRSYRCQARLKACFARSLLSIATTTN